MELFENQSGDPIIVQYVDSRAVAEDLSKSENGIGLVKVTKDTDLVMNHQFPLLVMYLFNTDSVQLHV